MIRHTILLRPLLPLLLLLIAPVAGAEGIIEYALNKVI